MAYRIIPTLTLAVILPLAGCAYHWEALPGQRPGANFKQDEAQCYLVSRGMPHDGYMFAGGGTGTAGSYAALSASLGALSAAMARISQQQQDQEACMTMAGWAKVRDK